MPRKNDPPAPKEAQRQKLADDVDEFLRRGGSIEYIDSGVSGVSYAGSKDKAVKAAAPSRSAK